MTKDTIKNRQYQKDWYYRNTEKKIALRRAKLVQRRDMISEIKNVPCADCGKKYPPYVMDFDHKGEEPKLFNIGQGWFRKWESILAEIDKCDVVCANCHRIRTYNRSQTRLV